MSSNISMVEAQLPPGFRFHPRDDELVCDYLMKKVTHTSQSLLLIEVDLNKCEPWDIPEKACVGGKEWYFYSHRDRKYATGLRTNRATTSGYWKATGKDRAILRKGGLVGMRKTLVFYQGRAPKGRKTEWVMHEFRLEGPFASAKVSSLKEDWVLCRVFYKNREVSGQQSMYDDTAGSSSLPPLMDSYITFDQTPPNFHDHDDYYNEQQVPCFSIFSSSHPQDQIITNPIFPHFSHLQPNNNISTTNSTTFGKYIPFESACLLDPSACDNKAVKAVLNQLNKIDNNVPNMQGSSPSSESHLSEVGMPANMWNHYS